jgi:PRTRC genetic system protein B
VKLVVDASVLVGEVLRVRGVALLLHPDLSLVQPEHAHAETRHELRRRGTLMVRHGRATQDAVTTLLDTAFAFLDTRVQVVAASEYAAREAQARRRIPRDPNDWPLVALALTLGELPILTQDGDFLGCGLPTWTPETLRAHLNLSSWPPVGGQLARMPVSVTLDTPPSQLTPPEPYLPELALLLYRKRGGGVELLKHPVQAAPQGPMLGAGGHLTVPDQDALLTFLTGTGLRWVNERTLACGHAQVCWWVPPGERALLFDAKYAQTASIARLSGVPVPLPGLVMIAQPNRLQVYAVRGDARPGAGTPVYAAPFWNMFSSNVVCRGTVSYPASCTPGTQDAWETAFFQSVFTGPSRSDRYLEWGRSYEELLETAIRAGAFPERVLVATGQTLTEVLG